MRAIRYEEYSDTVRAVPENYCLAVRRNGKWKAYDDHAVKHLWGIIAVICFIVNIITTTKRSNQND